MTTKARDDFERLIAAKAKLTDDGCFGPGAMPLEKFIDREYRERQEVYSPRQAAPAPETSPKTIATMEEIVPTADRTTLDRVWKAIGEAWADSRK